LGSRREEDLTPAERLAFSKKGRPVGYKPHTMSEYKVAKDALGIGKDAAYVQLGALGPDLQTEELIAKRAAREKAMAYAAQARPLAKSIAPPAPDHYVTAGRAPVPRKKTDTGKSPGGPGSPSQNPDMSPLGHHRGKAESEASEVDTFEFTYVPLAGLPYGPDVGLGLGDEAAGDNKERKAKRGAGKVSQDMLRKEAARESRQRALDFAKKVPKPQYVPRSHVPQGPAGSPTMNAVGSPHSYRSGGRSPLRGQGSPSALSPSAAGGVPVEQNAGVLQRIMAELGPAGADPNRGKIQYAKPPPHSGRVTHDVPYRTGVANANANLAAGASLEDLLNRHDALKQKADRIKDDLFH
jgi:hypothetical protein